MKTYTGLFFVIGAVFSQAHGKWFDFLYYLTTGTKIGPIAVHITKFISSLDFRKHFETSLTVKFIEVPTFLKLHFLNDFRIVFLKAKES